MRLFVQLLALTGLLSAQWIHLPTPGVPKGKDGNPNMAAPAPRLNGKPDLSGMWIIASALPCPPIIKDDAGECLEKTPIAQSTADLNKIVPGGIPYTPWSVAKMQERKKQLDPHVQCLPSNFPRMYTLPHITKFIQGKDELALLNEYNASYRQIFLDGRKLPNDPQPSWNGYSTAHWEGDVLVSESNGFRDDLWMDMAGTPLTNAARVTERFRRPNFGSLVIEATVTDPKAFTKSWTMKIDMKLALDTELIDEVCLEGERSVSHLK
jgi:hypothetical protein